MPVLHRDLESRSAISLKGVGTWRYAADATTAVLCVAYAVDGAPVQLWIPGQPIPQEFIEATRDPWWCFDVDCGPCPGGGLDSLQRGPAQVEGGSRLEAPEQGEAGAERNVGNGILRTRA